MGILNVTPDSFSDGGKYIDLEAALRRAEEMIAEGADMIDIGGESTRPGSKPVRAREELARVAPIIEKLAAQFDIPLSIDTSRAETAHAALGLGAEIINDIAGMRWDPNMPQVAEASKAGVVLMGSVGAFETMHSPPTDRDILPDVIKSLRWSVNEAKTAGVADEQIVVDPGIGFGKTVEQNLELIGKLDNIVSEFTPLPVLVGASRKSFIAKFAGDVPPSERLGGSIAAAVLAVQNGAKIVRVHDVAATVQALKVWSAIEQQ